MNTAFTIIITICATAHLLSTIMVGVFAARRVQYLSLTVILGIISIGLITCGILFNGYEQTVDVGLIHPSIVLPLAASAFLESIYPLTFIMPGFLQWQRSVKYALPLIIVITGYFIGVMIAGHAPILYTLRDIADNLLLVPDVIVRIVALGLAIYYIIGIILLPKRMLRRGVEIPIYLKGYCTWLMISYIFFITLSIHFEWWILYVVLFAITTTNVTFVMHSLEKIAENLPRPTIYVAGKTEEPGITEETDDSMERDFNEANIKRFHKVEQFMQSSRAWTDVSFTRDNICEAVGFSRHLLLQSLRSQGYNNVHEYITTYRVELLKKIIERNQADTLTQAAEMCGFATLVTARSAYKKITGNDLK